MREVPRDWVDTIVIGGGQCGLAAGYHLRQAGRQFVVVDPHPRAGGAWRGRWDSLHLFTQNRFNALDGLAFPGPPKAFPSKDHMADYLEQYAEKFELPVRYKTTVDRLWREGDSFVVSTDQGCLKADNVIVAVGGTPRAPAFAADLNPDIRQMHTSEYQRPAQLRDGPTLLVGAGNSGAEIALDLAPGRRTLLSGRDVGQAPLLNGSVYWWLIHRRLTVDTVVGRRMRDMRLGNTTPLVRVTRRALADAGVERVARTAGVRDGKPVLEDGRVVDVANVLWCTGFARDFGWIDLPVFAENGFPKHYRGVVATVPGLYFVGLPFQYTLTSGVVGGVSRDAEHVVAHLCAQPCRTGDDSSPSVQRR